MNYPQESEKKQNKVESIKVKAQKTHRLASLKPSQQEEAVEIVRDGWLEILSAKVLMVLMNCSLSLWTLVSQALGSFEYVGILDII